MSTREQITKTLDNPIRILFWTLDEFLVMAIPLFLGLCFGSLILMLGVLLLKPCHTKFKKRFPQGACKHLLYWNLPSIWLRRLGKMKQLPSSHQRELLL